MARKRKELTENQIEAARLLIRGWTLREIALELATTSDTVRGWSRQKLFSKAIEIAVNEELERRRKAFYQFGQ